MRSVFFTKPKPCTLCMLEHMVGQGEDIRAVVLSGKDAYAETDMVRFCEANAIPIVDYAECGALFESEETVEMIWCCTFPKLVKKEWIDKAAVAAVNFHAAPLPEYRGVFGYNFAILNDEVEYGVTAHMMDARFDMGDVIEVDRFPYDTRSGSVRELVGLSEARMVSLFGRTYDRFASGERVELRSQKASEGRYYSRSDFDRAKVISPFDDEDVVERKVRAYWYPPYEGAYVEVEGKRLLVVTKEILDGLQ